MSRRSKAQIAQDQADEAAWRELHAQAAADHIRQNPDTNFHPEYRALAAQAKEPA